MHRRWSVVFPDIFRRTRPTGVRDVRSTVACGRRAPCDSSPGSKQIQLVARHGLRLRPFPVVLPFGSENPPARSTHSRPVCGATPAWCGRIPPYVGAGCRWFWPETRPLAGRIPKSALDQRTPLPLPPPDPVRSASVQSPHSPLLVLLHESGQDAQRLGRPVALQRFALRSSFSRRARRRPLPTPVPPAPVIALVLPAETIPRSFRAILRPSERYERRSH